jgi:hypothetical protein
MLWNQVDRVGRLVYMKRLLWIRARIFLFVKRQSSVDHHVTRIRPSIVIGKEHQDHHPVKFIMSYIICSLVTCMDSRVVVGGPHTVSLSDFKFTSIWWLLYQYLCIKAFPPPFLTYLLLLKQRSHHVEWTYYLSAFIKIDFNTVWLYSL